MSLHLFRCRFVCLLIPILIGAIALSAEPEKVVTHDFKTGTVSKSEMQIQGQKQKIDADTEIYYTWEKNGRQRILSFDSMQLKVNINGMETMNSFMSRKKFTNKEKGKTIELSIDMAPEQLKTMLQDTFGVPVCKLQVDEEGREMKRTVVAGPGAKAVIDNGIIANALLFHPPYSSAKNEWQADTEITMGYGGFVKGKLTYQKMPGGKGGQLVKVTGKLSKDSYQPPGKPLTIKDAIYVVNGEQTYDPATKEWVSGKLTMNVSMKMNSDKKTIGSAKGTMEVNFEKCPGKK